MTIGIFYIVIYYLSFYSALAAIIIPLDFEFDAIFVTYKPWRFFIALVGSLNILSGLLIYFLLPESPKYLLARGQEEEALDILRYMYAKNTGKSPDSFEVIIDIRYKEKFMN